MEKILPLLMALANKLTFQKELLKLEHKSKILLLIMIKKNFKKELLNYLAVLLSLKLALQLKLK